MTSSKNMPKESPAFARKAGSYDLHASVQADAAHWLAEWLPKNASHESCLELGAGTGLFSQHLANRFKQLECTDISPEMLEHCRERLPEANHRVLNAWEAPGCGDPRWDRITSCSLLQWAPSPVSVLQNWSDRLNTNGSMSLGFFVAPSLPELDQVLKGDSPVTWHSPEVWQDAMLATGLELEQMETITQRYHYASALEFWKSLHGTGCNVSRRLTSGKLRRLLREYEAAFQSDAGVYATWTFCRAQLKA